MHLSLNRLALKPSIRSFWSRVRVRLYLPGLTISLAHLHARKVSSVFFRAILDTPILSYWRQMCGNACYLDVVTQPISHKMNQPLVRWNYHLGNPQLNHEVCSWKEDHNKVDMIHIWLPLHSYAKEHSIARICTLSTTYFSVLFSILKWISFKKNGSPVE